jgi:progressive ankylosis protein
MIGPSLEFDPSVTSVASSAPPLPTRTILAFWAPLAATWLMMAVEGPYVAAIIARLADPTRNLAAYGVAFSFAFMAEAPIIMMMTAANALVADRQSLLALRRFMFRLNGALTIAMAVGLTPPVFRFVTDRLIGLPADVARLTHLATALLVLWPAAIGYRRFYQGILVRHGQPRRVAYGTVVRLVTMSAAAAGLALWTRLPGASVGALALVSGVIAEAAASRWMAHDVIGRVLARDATSRTVPLTGAEIARFYVPLALTSLLAIVVNPLVTFFLGRSRSPLESLAVLPVVLGFVFIFRSGAIAYQEVGVALTGDGRRNERPIARVAFGLAAFSTLALAGVLFTPLGEAWFLVVSGLSPELARFALWPARILVLLPALDYLISLQRAWLVLARRTRVITAATAVEACAIVAVLVVSINVLHLVGAIAAAAAILLGRLGGNAFLLAPASRRERQAPHPSPAPGR